MCQIHPCSSKIIGKAADKIERNGNTSQISKRSKLEDHQWYSWTIHFHTLRFQSSNNTL